MTPEYKASVEASKHAMLARLTEAMQALEQALVIATHTGKTDSELSPLYRALAATLLVKIKATEDAA